IHNMHSQNNALGRISRCLFKMLSSLQIQSRKQAVLEAHCIPYHDIICQTLKQQKEVPAEVDQLYSLIFKEPWIKIVNLNSILQGILKHSCAYFFERGVICIIEKLQRQSLSLPEKLTLAAHLFQFYTAITESKLTFSLDFYYFCAKSPMLDLNFLEDT